MNESRRLAAKDAAAFLGVSASRYHQIRTAKDGPLAGATSVTVEALRRLPIAERRLKWCQDTVDGIDMPTIATDCSSTVLAMNRAAARLLYRSVGDVLGRPIAEIGIRRTDADEFVVSRLMWDAGVRQVVVLRARRTGDETSSAIGLSDDRRRRVDEACSALDGNEPGRWIAEAQPQFFPTLGGGERRVRGRVFRVGEGPPTVLLHTFSVPSLTATIAEDTSALVLTEQHREPPAGSDDQPTTVAALQQAKFLQLVTKYAKEIATEFLAESVTIFAFRGAFCPTPRDPDKPATARTRALLPIGRFGLPDVLTSREIFYADGDDRGLVMDVMQSGGGRVIDFSDPAKYVGIRRPNFYNATLNMRAGRLTNGIIVPIMLDSSDGSAESRQPIGAIRAINCFHPEGDERFEPAEPSWAIESLQRIAHRIALLHRQVWRRAQWDLLHETIRNLGATADLDAFLAALGRDVLQLLSFEHVACWRPRARTDDMTLRSHAGGGGVPTSPSPAGDPPSVAFREKRAIHITGARSRKRGTTTSEFFDRVRNGVEVPVHLPDGLLWGTIGFYDNWVTDVDGPYARQTIQLCEQVARLVGVKIALSGAPRARRRA